MLTNASLPEGTLLAFLLVLARVSGAVAFIPFPGLKNGPDITRVTFSVLVTWCLRPVWPRMLVENPGMGTLTMWILREAAFGILLGLFISFLLEAFQLGAQFLAVQAGYSYASTIDPTSQADSGVLAVVVQLLAGVCFFATGVDGELIRSLAFSFERIPPGQFHASPMVQSTIVQAGADMFVSGLRLALPVIAFLLLVDLALALLGRMQTQLQLLSLAFPVKMLLTLVLMASLAAMFPALFQAAARQTIRSISRAIG